MLKNYYSGQNEQDKQIKQRENWKRIWLTRPQTSVIMMVLLHLPWCCLWILTKNPFWFLMPKTILFFSHYTCYRSIR